MDMLNGKIFGIPEALQSLAPGSQWILTGEDIEGLVWLDKNTAQPGSEEILAEIERLQDEYGALSYQRLRAPEYPDMSDYLDGIVKGDEEQVQAYIAACLAVKEKYPKPE